MLPHRFSELGSVTQRSSTAPLGAVPDVLAVLTLATVPANMVLSPNRKKR